MTRLACWSRGVLLLCQELDIDVINRNGAYGILVLDKKEGHTKVRVGWRSAAGKRKAGGLVLNETSILVYNKTI